MADAKKIILVILDGWGEGPPGKGNAVAGAHTPFMDSLKDRYPYAPLLTSGANVGLPDGQMGNSEVGHLNIGAGRVVMQELALINHAIDTHALDDNRVLARLFSYCIDRQKPLHMIGLVSEGGVHSHTRHLVSLCRLAHRFGVGEIMIHAFTDGRDTDPHDAKHGLTRLADEIKDTGAQLASVVGRYYAMDRDKRWERIKIAYDLLVHGKGQTNPGVAAAIQASYDHGITDEFIKPIVVGGRRIESGDAVLCFNFRTDRCRQLTMALTQADLPDYGMKTQSLKYVTMTRYDDTFKNVDVVFDKENLHHTLGEVLSQAGKKQLRISETEKYPHVTFFFSGGREEVFDGEKRIMIPSPKVATYDLQPAMSAPLVKDAMLAEIKEKSFDFACINFANADMVGHTGVYEAAVKAVETVDACVAEIVRSGLDNGYSFLITADHGNAETMLNEDGTPNTAHTTHTVPCFYVDREDQKALLRPGLLADLAPTVLSLMGIGIPPEMTGKTLLKS